MASPHPHNPTFPNLQAANPNGYWRLNMNQACYEGEHWSKWTPIGIVMSIVVCLGIPFVTFLPVFLNRKTLATAKTQVSIGPLFPLSTSYPPLLTTCTLRCTGDGSRGWALRGCSEFYWG